MTTLHYVILAGLIRKPRSGYDLTRWMERETSHFFVIGHSSIYPALARMERGGLVRHETVPSDRGPERKVYSITEAGREALLAWAYEPPSERHLRDEQLVKTLCYPYMAKEHALARLEEEKARHEEKPARYEEYEHQREDLFGKGGLSHEAYLGTKLTLARGLGAEKSYVGGARMRPACCRGRIHSMKSMVPSKGMDCLVDQGTLTNAQSWICPRSSKQPRSCTVAPWTTCCRQSERWLAHRRNWTPLG